MQPSSWISYLYSYLPSFGATEATAASAVASNPSGVNYSSSITSAPAGAEAEQPPVFSPPAITPPSHVALFVIQLMESVYLTGSSLLRLGFDELHVISEKTQKQGQEIAQQMAKTLSWTQQTDMWSTLQRMSGYILSAYNLAMGGSIYAAGSPMLGTTLIAAGILSAANIALTEMGGWDYISEQLAQNNKHLQEQILFWGPLTLYALSATTSLTVAYDPLGLIQTPSLEWENLLGGLQSTVTAGQTVSRSGLTWSKASLTSLQNTLFTDVFARDVLVSWIQTLTETLEHGWDLARNIVSLTSQMKV